MTTHFKLSAFALAIVLCAPLNAQANAIIPYMVVPWGQVFLLPIVILIEVVILRRLAGGTALTVLFHTFIANLISTALGAALYFVTMPLVADPLYYWWFKGEFASEAVRNACIALIFAVVLWCISWASETMVIARLRKTSFQIISAPSAWANLATYVLLLGLSLLSQH